MNENENFDKILSGIYLHLLKSKNLNEFSSFFIKSPSEIKDIFKLKDYQLNEFYYQYFGFIKIIRIKFSL